MPCFATPGLTPSAAATSTPWCALRTRDFAAPDLGTLRCTLSPLVFLPTKRRFLTQVSLYDARHAQLLGTLDERRIDVRSSSDAIRDYFIAFLGGADAIQPLFSDAPERAVAPLLTASPPPLPPSGALQQLGGGVCAYSGYYCFAIRGRDGDRTACAKFTFVLRRDAAAGGALRIVLHNSGLTPRGIIAAQPTAPARA